MYSVTSCQMTMYSTHEMLMRVYGQHVSYNMPVLLPRGRLGYSRLTSYACYCPGRQSSPSGQHIHRCIVRAIRAGKPMRHDHNRLAHAADRVQTAIYKGQLRSGSDIDLTICRQLALVRWV